MILKTSSTILNRHKKSKLPEKEFKIRNSLLTEKLKNSNDVKGIYYLFWIILLNLLATSCLGDYAKTGKFSFGFRLIVSGFNKFYLVILIWGIFNLLACLSYYCFNFWGNVRILLLSKSTVLKKFDAFFARQLWDKLWITILIFYYFFSLYGVQELVRILHFNVASASVLVAEQIRLLMKQHAFIRTNAPRFLNYKPHSDEVLKSPDFQKFVYFLFAPTAVYRDEYPRIQEIRWKLILRYVGEMFGTIWLLSLSVEKFLIPPFQDLCLRKLTFNEMLASIFTNNFTGYIGLLCIFYTILHITQNAGAELLRFGDRLFYQEWWSSRSYSEYYRTWNGLVHDWLYTYVYKDFYEIVTPNNKTAAKLAVFLLSACFHEWGISVTLQLFLPVQFICFFIFGGIFFVIMKNVKFGGFILMYSLVLGSGFITNLYTAEYFARVNCPVEDDGTILEFFKPRFITCGCVG